MIEFIHRHPIFIKGLLTVVTLTFVLTGGWILGREDITEYAAKVEDEKISLKEYDDALYRMQEFYRKIYQGSIPDEVMKGLNLNKKALDTLIDRKLIMLAAEKENVKVTDEELNEAVTGNSAFLDEKGNFSKARYAEVLKYNGTNAAAFERSLREDLTAEKFRKMVKDSVYVTENDLREHYKKQLESQKKPFREEEYQAQRENLLRITTLLEQEKAMNSFMEGLRAGYKVEINPQILIPQS